MSVDWTKPIQTKDGRKARVLCTDFLSANYRVVVAVLHRHGHESAEKYTEDGAYLYLKRHCSHPMDIINVPPRKEMKEIVEWAVVDNVGAVVFTSSIMEFAADIARRHGYCRVVRLTGAVEVEEQE